MKSINKDVLINLNKRVMFFFLQVDYISSFQEESPLRDGGERGHEMTQFDQLEVGIVPLDEYDEDQVRNQKAK